MPICTADFDLIRGLVEREAAIVLGEEKRYLVETRMDLLARALGVPRDALLQRVRTAADRELRQQVVEAMTTNETWFFRDGHPFDTLRTHVLPALIEARAATRRLAIWSAACSTGQEPYSLAILLREHFPELAGWKVTLLATDIDRAALTRAQAGRFSDVELRRGMPQSLVPRYFRRDGDGWVLDEAVRAMVEFRPLNFKGGWAGLPPMDLVLLRNVLIYFSTDTKCEILGRVQKVLQPDGYLLLGSSETTHFLDDAFGSVQLGSSVCYRLRRPSRRVA